MSTSILVSPEEMSKHFAKRLIFGDDNDAKDATTDSGFVVETTFEIVRLVMSDGFLNGSGGVFGKLGSAEGRIRDCDRGSMGLLTEVSIPRSIASAMVPFPTMTEDLIGETTRGSCSCVFTKEEDPAMVAVTTPVVSMTGVMSCLIGRTSAMASEFELVFPFSMALSILVLVLLAIDSWELLVNFGFGLVGFARFVSGLVFVPPFVISDNGLEAATVFLFGGKPVGTVLM